MVDLRMKHAQKIILGGLLTALFFISVRFTCPTVPPRDSGELIAAQAGYGIGHPPGYPFFVNLGRIFSFLPLANTAFRQNLLSNVINITALIFLFFAVRALTAGAFLPALSSVFILGLSFHFIQYSIMAEVFALNNLFISILLYSAVSSEGFSYKKFSCIFIFTAGLAVAHHQTVILLFPGLLYFLYSEKTSPVVFFKPKYLALFLVPILLYLYLYIRAGRGPDMNWSDPSNISNLYRVVSRQDYGRFKLYDKSHQVFSVSLIFRHMAHYSLVLISDFTIIGFVLACIGFVSSFFLFLLFFFSGIFFIILANTPFDDLSLSILEKFYVLPSLFFAAACGLGLYRLKGRAGAFAAVTLIIFGVMNFISRREEISKRDFFYAYDMGKNIFRDIGQNGLLFTKGDNGRFVTWYLQLVEKHRLDVLHLDTVMPPYTGPERKIKWSGLKLPSSPMGPEEFARNILLLNPERRTHFLGDPEKENAGIPGLEFSQAGLSVRSGAVLPETVERNIRDSYIMRGAYTSGGDRHFFIREILNIYASVYDKIGLMHGIRERDDRALLFFNKALSVKREFSLARYHKGLALYKIEKYAPAAEEFLKVTATEKDKPEVYRYLVLSCINSGDSGSAVLYASEAVRLFPGNADFYNLLGAAYYKMNDFVLARKAFIECLRISPGYKEASANLKLPGMENRE